MVKTAELLKFEYRDYKDPVNKIHRLLKEGKLFALKKGYYETNEHADPFSLARSICNPSYISFESALSFHGLIPERVYAITSATLNKKKDKQYTNHFGRFTYQDIPERVYPYGVLFVKLDDGSSFQIATKEKALCDKLYKMSPIKNYDELTSLLFDSLRIDEDILNEFNIDDMALYAEKYHSTNVDILYRYLKRKNRWPRF